MMTIHGMSDALYALESNGLGYPTRGQAAVWCDIANEIAPYALDRDALVAAERVVAKLADHPRPRPCATLGRFIAEIQHMAKESLARTGGQA